MADRNRHIRDLTEGPLIPAIIRFIVPIITMNLLQNLYNAADMMIVGLSDVPGAIGSIGTTSAMNNFFISLFTGFAVGANIMVARYIGARNEKAVSEAVHTAVCVNAVVGVLFGTVGFIAAPAILRMIGDEGNVLRLATVYSRIVFCGHPFTSLTNCCLNIFRGRGDSRTPMLVMAGSGLLNVVLNLFFVVVCGLSVEGVALATVISQFASASVMLFLLHRDEGWTHLDLRKLRITRSAMKSQLAMGIPAAVQGCVFSISNMLISSSIVTMNNLYYPGGSAILDGNSAASSLEAFLHAAAVSCNHATVSFAGQHVGAKKYGRLRRVRRTLLIISIVLCMSLAGIMILFRDFFLRLYVTEQGALDAAFVRMKIIYTTYFLIAAMDVMSGFLRGIGKSLLSTVNSLLGSCVFRVLWITFVFSRVQTLEIIYYSYPISWAITTVLSFAAGEMALRRMSREAAQPEKEEERS